MVAVDPLPIQEQQARPDTGRMRLFGWIGNFSFAGNNPWNREWFGSVAEQYRTYAIWTSIDYYRAGLLVYRYKLFDPGGTRLITWNEADQTRRGHGPTRNRAWRHSGIDQGAQLGCCEREELRIVWV